MLICLVTFTLVQKLLNNSHDTSITLTAKTVADLKLAVTSELNNLKFKCGQNWANVNRI